MGTKSKSDQIVKMKTTAPEGTIVRVVASTRRNERFAPAGKPACGCLWRSA
jgi:hypothetical protein